MLTSIIGLSDVTHISYVEAFSRKSISLNQTSPEVVLILKIAVGFLALLLSIKRSRKPAALIDISRSFLQPLQAGTVL
jgi:nucleoside permease NupC